jgi:hypothetical protein
MNDLLSKVKIASPCHARWEDMKGDDRSRFCSRCSKHVYNFSTMSADEVAELVRAKEGNLCGRFYRRKDGTMLTANCPVGARSYSRRLQLLVGTAVGMIFTSLGLAEWSRWEIGSRPPNPFVLKCDNALWKVKGWMGLNPKPTNPGPMVMGRICIVPSPGPSQPTGASANGTPPPVLLTIEITPR